MKKLKGQGLVQFILLTMLVLGVCTGAVFALGAALKGVFGSNNPAKTFNAKRTIQYERPSNLVSNVAVTVCGLTVSSPVEKVIKANLLNGTYTQTSGSYGRSTEIAQIMQEYAAQLNTVVNTLTASPQRASYLSALNAYKLVIDNALTKITAAAGDKLKIDVAVLEMTVKLDDSGTLATNLKNAETAYLATLIASSKKQIVDIYTSDLLSFAKSMDYSINPSVYNNVLGASPNGTLVQDLALVNQINADIAGYSASVKDNYEKKIDIDGTENYSSLAPDTYNDAALCAELGGSGNPCVL